MDNCVLLNVNFKPPKAYSRASQTDMTIKQCNQSFEKSIDCMIIPIDSSDIHIPMYNNFPFNLTQSYAGNIGFYQLDDKAKNRTQFKTQSKR
ncbi:CLUMA_CG021494, isoform A [Clunio marinus]|uniref:CLUMA_CG021494, isoform A n=1 Tax=Clunio marinus TaxID=568069 RepID=A0A1J1J863_9DIPT|nr:CLUMA_CG021494, isoform A [Clunio marinus]